MTIVAGFKCYEGIVICADTQETISNVSKRNVPKLRFEPLGEPHKGDDLAAAFCGAGDNANFIDKIIETAWEDAQSATSLDEACADIEKSIKQTYMEFGQIYQPGFCPGADLIYGVKMYNTCRLFSAHDAVVVEKQTYDSWGAGYYMADFLASRMYEHHLSLRQCVILAAYILFQAKEHVDGCGGDSHIAILRDNGVSGVVQSDFVVEVTKLLKSADKSVGELLLDAASLSMPSDQFKERAAQATHWLGLLRDHSQEEYETNRGIMLGWAAGLSGKEPEQQDEFGLPMPPSNSEK